MIISESAHIADIFFIESAPRPIQSISRDVCLFVCHVFVPSMGDRNREGWGLLVKECIAKIAKLFELLRLCLGEPAHYA